MPDDRELLAGAQAISFGEIAVEIGQHEAGRERRHCRPAKPKQRCRRDEFADRRFQLVRDLRHGRDLHEIEIPQEADPHHTRYDMQPAKQKRPKHAVESTGIGEEIKRGNGDGEDESRNHRVAQICQ